MSIGALGHVPGVMYRQGSGDVHVLDLDPYYVEQQYMAMQLVIELRDIGYQIDFQGPGFIVVSPLPAISAPAP